MVRPLGDMTPIVDLLYEKGTGPVRVRRPIYKDLMPPCNHACPAGENIQGWLAHAQAGRYHEAWLELVNDNPLPAVHGRVCYHPCESSCNRGQVDMPVGIHAVERFLGDLAIAEGWEIPVAPPTGKRVLVVGSGPCGLSAAYHAARLGHTVEIQEAAAFPGGMMYFGIPDYRLPRETLLQEIRRIEALGVGIVLDHPVKDVRAEMKAGGFDAVFIAIGAQLDRHVNIPASDLTRLLPALDLLGDIKANDPPKLGRRVIVYGGGNTAMDAARSARRLGANEPLIVYRRDRAHMPAHESELNDALAEGVKVKWLSTIKSIGDREIFVEEMELDAEGFPQPTGRVERLEADAVVLALGEEVDSAFLGSIPEIAALPGGRVGVDDNMMTGSPGIFAGGDMVPGPASVTIATGHGKRGARAIDAWLRGTTPVRTPKNSIATLEMLHLPIYSDVHPKREAELTVAERVAGFNEVVAGLSELEARYEAQRCFSCGNCFECDNCYAACPEHGIIKLGPGRRYQIDYALCTGCGECFEQCPSHAIEMIPEPAVAR